VDMATHGRVAAVALVPAGSALPFQQAAGRVSFVVPRLRGHQMVEVSYG